MMSPNGMARPRPQRLLCWAAAGEALRKAQGACDAHISEDAGNYHHDRATSVRIRSTWLGWTSGAQSFCS
jgi:hypothetical protein